MTRVTLKQRARDIWQKLARLDAEPIEIAAGFCIGIASGFIPLNPSPIIIATAAAWLARQNLVAAVVGATLSVFYTPLLPILWLLEYKLGRSILPVHSPAPGNRADLWWVVQNGWDTYAAMFVGSIIIAAPFTLLSYLVVKCLAARWDRQKKALRSSD